LSFTVAIVGRPNVGKSTLFNRLVGKRLALVDDTPGVTRDRRAGAARLGDLAFTIVDTAGFEEARPETLSGRMRAQTEAAVAQSDAVMFLVDARTGLTPVDRAFADLLRRSDRPVILVANKSEGTAGEAGALEAYAAKAWAISTTRCAPRCPTPPRLRPRARRRRRARRRPRRRRRSAWPWSDGRIPASRP
jgi:GTP-binding protein